MSEHAYSSRDENDVLIVASGGISPTGRNPQEAHAAAMDFRTGIRELTQDDIPNFELYAQAMGLTSEDEKAAFFRNAWGEKCGVGGVIPDEFYPEEDFYPRSFFHKGEKIVGTQVLQAYIVMDQIRSQLPQLFSDEGRINPDLAPETMIDLATGAGCSMEMTEREQLEFLLSPNDHRKGVNYGRKKWLLGMLGNMIPGQMASQFGVEGAQNSSNSACSSSGLSMWNGFNAIKAGSADIAIAGGSEYPVGPVATYVSFDHMMKKRGALTRKWREDRDATKALVAYGAVRDGFVPGNAAGIIVMMRRKVADQLQIEPQAEVLGIAANTCQSEKYGKSMADGTITGQAALLERLFEKIGMPPSDIRGRLVHFLHGTGTKSGAINEVHAAAVALGDMAKDERYVGTGIKEREGHSLGTATVANVVAAMQAMQHKKVPGLPNTTEVDPAFQEVDPGIVGKEGVEVDGDALRAVADSILCQKHADFDPEADIVIADSKGFGGTNVAVGLMSP